MISVMIFGFLRWSAQNLDNRDTWCCNVQRLSKYDSHVRALCAGVVQHLLEGAGKEGHSTEEGPRILLWFSSVPTQLLSCESIVQAAIKRLEGSVWGSTFNTEGRRFHLKINTEGSIVVKVRPHTTPLSLLLLTICLKETCLMNNRCTQDALNSTQISYFVEQIQIQLQIQIQILIQI